MDQCAKGQATPEEQELRNREHSGADRKMKNVKYCTELKTTALESVGTWVVVNHHVSI
jgi:hypothetical protein